jgi:hypothetical protein
VYGGELVAISQYNYLCYFEEIAKNKEKIEKKIKKFYEKIKQSVIDNLNGSCIADFYLIKSKLDDDDDGIGLIELNPYEITTGACLFSWKIDEKILQEGPFEFRIMEKKRTDFSIILDEFKKYYRLIEE